MTAIVAAEVLWKFATAAGAAGNAGVGAALTSLGKYISTSAWAGGVANDLFDNITGAENAASQVDYRCLFIHNNNANNPYENVTLWLSAEVAGGAAIAIGVDTTVASAIASAAAQALTVASVTSAPVGVVFTSPTTFGTGIVLGTIPVGQCRAIWVKRTAANTVALSGDGVTFSIQGDTGSL